MSAELMPSFTMSIVHEDEKEAQQLLKLYEERLQSRNKNDVGIDIIFPEKTIIPVGELRMINTKLICQVSEVNGFRASYDLRPRSSAYKLHKDQKTCFMLCNTIGTVDGGYTGTINICIVNYGPNELVLDKHSVWYQLVNMTGYPYSEIKVGINLNLDSTERGAKGFGSSGN